MAKTTTQQTSKRWKLAQLLGFMGTAIGIALLLFDLPKGGTFLGVGLPLWFMGKAGAWWFNA